MKYGGDPTQPSFHHQPTHFQSLSWNQSTTWKSVKQHSRNQQEQFPRSDFPYLLSMRPGGNAFVKCNSECGCDSAPQKGWNCAHDDRPGRLRANQPFRVAMSTTMALLRRPEQPLKHAEPATEPPSATKLVVLELSDSGTVPPTSTPIAGSY